jgi:predicted acetyltransferase
MTKDQVRLIEPTVNLREAYLDFVEDFRAAGEGEIHGTGGWGEGDFGAFVAKLRTEAEGRGLPEGYVPASTYWLVCGGRVIGTCNLRHRLTEALRDFGGHIGYSVRPSERRKGYGTRMLKLALEEARLLGVRRALVTCAADNIASARVIENNGGVLDSRATHPVPAASPEDTGSNWAIEPARPPAVRSRQDHADHCRRT